MCVVYATSEKEYRKQEPASSAQIYRIRASHVWNPKSKVFQYPTAKLYGKVWLHFEVRVHGGSSVPINEMVHLHSRRIICASALLIMQEIFASRWMCGVTQSLRASCPVTLREPTA